MTEQEIKHGKAVRAAWLRGWKGAASGGLCANFEEDGSSEWLAWEAGSIAGWASVKAAREDSRMYVLPGIYYCLMWSRGVEV